MNQAQLAAGIRQAARYGKQVAELESHIGNEASRRAVRRAWRRFRGQFQLIDGYPMDEITDAYWYAYDQEIGLSPI